MTALLLLWLGCGGVPAPVAETPLAARDSVWLEELTWMEVRDALAAGKTTALVPTGGVEANGPYLATGKHNLIVGAACEAMARLLEDALCAPVLKLVPEGDIDPPTDAMAFPGTLSLRQETYVAVLVDVGASLHQHGFTDVVFFGDSGGNQAGMAEATSLLNARWGGSGARHLPDYYDYDEVFVYLDQELDIREPIDEGLHDDIAVTAMMMAVDPTSVRHAERVAAGRARINGVDISDGPATAELGRRLLAHRAERAVAALKRARQQCAEDCAPAR